MDTVNIALHYESLLSSFYEAVQWSDDAERGLQYTRTLNKSQREENEAREDMESLFPEYEGEVSGAGTTVTIDAELQRQILGNSASDFRKTPACSSEESLFFSAEERKMLYDYTLKNTVKPPTPPELTLYGEEGVPDEELEEVALKKRERDNKRRRQAYRSAATGSKTLHEVTREMISSMMELISPPERESRSQEVRSHREKDRNEHRRSGRRDERGRDRSESQHKRDRTYSEEHQERRYDSLDRHRDRSDKNRHHRSSHSKDYYKDRSQRNRRY